MYLHTDEIHKDYELPDPHEKYKNLLVKGLEHRQGMGEGGGEVGRQGDTRLWNIGI